MSDSTPSMTQRLAAMHELHFELSAVGSTDEVCRHAVSRGRFYIGIDRIGIWLLDLDDPRWFFGSYGIDETGSIRDERSIRIPLNSKVYDADFFERRVPYRFMSDHPVYDDRHGEVGRADLVVAPMWNGTLSIGAVCADTFLGEGAMTEDDCELVALLARMVGHLVTIKRSEEKLRESAAELERLATTDELTGFLNRRTGIQLLEHLITLARRTSDAVSVCFLDLDRLKRVNDTRGHRAGDRFILETARLMKDIVRESDILCRMGGDEFMVVFPMTRSRDAHTIMRRLSHVAEASDELGALTEAPWYSYGIAETEPTSGDNGGAKDDSVTSIAEDLIHRADLAMYEQKRLHKRW